MIGSPSPRGCWRRRTRWPNHHGMKSDADVSLRKETEIVFSVAHESEQLAQVAPIDLQWPSLPHCVAWLATFHDFEQKRRMSSFGLFDILIAIIPAESSCSHSASRSRSSKSQNERPSMTGTWKANRHPFATLGPCSSSCRRASFPNPRVLDRPALEVAGRGVVVPRRRACPVASPALRCPDPIPPRVRHASSHPNLKRAAPS